MDSSLQIEERASQWLARRESSEWSRSDEAALDAWLEQSTLHVVAFVRLEAAWIQAQGLKALRGGVPAGTVPSPQDWQLTPFFPKAAPAGPTTAVPPLLSNDATMMVPTPTSLLRASDAQGSLAPTVAPVVAPIVAPIVAIGGRYRLRSPSRVKLWGLAASLLLVTATGAIYYNWLWGSTYHTLVGGTASVPMSDGSRVTLNTDSKIRLAVTETERRVELQQGEAFFEVAKDATRPFVVQAGAKRVIAVGTKFSVRRDRSEVRVFISEGIVRIEDAGTASDGKDKGEEQLLTLAAGSVARASDNGVLIQEKTVAEIENYLSWRTGHLIFHDIRLAEAIAEFNRYNRERIVIEDPVVAEIRMSGKFRSNQSEAFVRLMEAGFSIRARRVGDQIVLSDSRKAAQKIAN